MVIRETEGDVVATYSGSAELSGFSESSSGGSTASAIDSDAYMLIGSGNVTQYSDITGPSSVGFDVGATMIATSSSGDPLALRMAEKELGLPTSYTSGAEISGTATWSGEDFDSLGILEGTYIWTWGSGATADSLVVQAVAESWHPAYRKSSVRHESTLSIANAWNVHYSSFDDLVYYSTRNSSSGAVYRIEADGSTTQIYTGSAPGGLFVDPESGGIFISYDYPGTVWRYENDLSLFQEWVSGFASGDDDTAGILIVPDYYGGSVAAPGDGFVTDRGYGGNESIFSFSKDTAEGETSLVSFNRADGLYGIVATDEQIIAVEYGNGLLELTENGGSYNLTPITTTPAVPQVKAAAWDDLRKVLYLALTDFNEAESVIAQYDPATGEVVTIVDGLSQMRWNSLSVSSDYSRLYAADYTAGELLTYTLSDSDGETGAVGLFIENHSFEVQMLTDGGYSASVSGWSTSGGSQQGVLNPTLAQYPDDVPDGNNVAYSNGGTISQTLSATFGSDTNYTLSVFVGGRADSSFQDTIVALYAGGIEVASGVIDSTSLSLGTFEEAVVSFDSLAGNPFIGQPIEIRLTSTAIQSNFDDVTLTSTKISQPGAGRESFYFSNYEKFFDQAQVFDGNVRKFGGPITVPTGSGQTAAVDFTVSPYPEIVSTPGGAQLSLGGGTEIDPSVLQVALTYLVRSQPVYNLTFYYEGLDTTESFEFPGQFPDRYPGLIQNGNLLETNNDDTDGSFTFLEVTADTLLEILFNRQDSEVLIIGIGFELVKPAYNGAPYAYSANTGWINFDASTRNLAVGIGLRTLSGYAYDANTGWIFLGDGSPLNGISYTNDGDDHGVNFNAGGDMSGFAWSANTGWISFDWADVADVNRPHIDPTTGVVTGYAWSANMGWIHLNGLELPEYVVPTSTDPALLNFGANFEQTTFTPYLYGANAYDDGNRDFDGTIDTSVGQSDALAFGLNIEGSFEVVEIDSTRVLDIGIGEAGESVIRFQSNDAALFNLTFNFEGFDIGEAFMFGAHLPDVYADLDLTDGVLTTSVDSLAHRFTFNEFPANTELVITVRHNGSSVRLTSIDFDASDSTIGEVAYAYAANTGWVHLKPNINTGIVVHESYLSGYAYDANTGWMKFGQRQPDNGHTYTNIGDDHGVNHDPAGVLYGYAWSGNVGWIYFGWAAFNDPNAPAIDLLTGDFSGYAWGANIGWINLGTGQLSTEELRVDDIDLDGMADTWERATFGNLTTAGVGTDQDGDTISDAAEFVGGTDADDASSYLRIISTNYNGAFTEVTVEFTSATNRVYTIEQAEDFNLADPWSDSGLGMIRGDSATTSRTFTYPDNARKFFRVQAVLPLSN